MSAPTKRPQFETIYPSQTPPQADFAEGATQIANPDTSKLFGNLLNTTAKRFIAIGGAALAGATIIGSTAYALGSDNAPAKIVVEKPHITGDTNGDGFLSKDELHNMTPSNVAEVDPSLLVAAYGPDFDAWRKDTYNILINKNVLTPEEIQVVHVPTGPKAQYSDQDVLNQVTLDVADASIQDDLTDGQRMLPLPFDHSAGGFSDNVAHIEPGKGSDVNAYRQVGESLPHPSGSFNGVDLSGYEQARVITQDLLLNTSIDQPSKEYGLYGLIKNGQNEEWQLIRRWKSSDDAVIQAIASLTPPASPAK